MRIDLNLKAQFFVKWGVFIQWANFLVGFEDHISIYHYGLRVVVTPVLIFPAKVFQKVKLNGKKNQKFNFSSPININQVS